MDIELQVCTTYISLVFLVSTSVSTDMGIFLFQKYPWSIYVYLKDLIAKIFRNEVNKFQKKISKCARAAHMSGLV